MQLLAVASPIEKCFTMVHALQNHVQTLLDCYSYADALILAELSFDDSPSDESAFLLATAMYRSGSFNEAALFLERRCSNTRCSELIFLRAEVLFETCQLDEAERVLLGDLEKSANSVQDTVVAVQRKFDVKTAPHALQLLGNIAFKNKSYALAHAALQLAIQLNPLSWSTYTLLCKLGKQALGPPPTSMELFKLFCRTIAAAGASESDVSSPRESNSDDVKTFEEMERNKCRDMVIVQRTRSAAGRGGSADYSQAFGDKSILSPLSVKRVAVDELRARALPEHAFFIAGENFATADQEESAPGNVGESVAEDCVVNATMGSKIADSPRFNLLVSVNDQDPDTSSIDMSSEVAGKRAGISLEPVIANVRSSPRRCAQVASERIKITVQQKRRGQKAGPLKAASTVMSPLALHGTSSIMPLAGSHLTSYAPSASMADDFMIMSRRIASELYEPPSSVLRERVAESLSPPIASEIQANVGNGDDDDINDDNGFDLSMLDEPLPSSIAPRRMMPPPLQRTSPALSATHSSSFEDDTSSEASSPLGDDAPDKSSSGLQRQKQLRSVKRNLTFSSRDSSDLFALPDNTSHSQASKRVRIQQQQQQQTNTVRKVNTYITPLSQPVVADDAVVEAPQKQPVAKVFTGRKKNLWRTIDYVQQNFDADSTTAKNDNILLINYDKLDLASQQLIRVAENFCLFTRPLLQLEQFNCTRALQLLNQLPSHLSNTTLRHYLAGRAYFIKTEYSRSVVEFEEMLAQSPYINRGFDLFSSALWHEGCKQKLSALAKFMRVHYQATAEASVVLANTFSLIDNDHALAIRQLRRAIQARDDYYYAHNLLGFEYSARAQPEDDKKALESFQQAVEIDPFSYYAYYGMATVHYKKSGDAADAGTGDSDGMETGIRAEKQAYVYFRRAYEICPANPILVVQLALASHRLYGKAKNASALQKDESLSLLRRASRLHPQHHVVKFQLAQILFSRQLFDEATEILLELVDLLPKEALVFFLLGKAYESRQETQHKALRCFSIACDLDPKGRANNNFLKEAFDKIHAAVVS